MYIDWHQTSPTNLHVWKMTRLSQVSVSNTRADVIVLLFLLNKTKTQMKRSFLNNCPKPHIFDVLIMVCISFIFLPFICPILRTSVNKDRLLLLLFYLLFIVYCCFAVITNLTMIETINNNLICFRSMDFHLKSLGAEAWWKTETKFRKPFILFFTCYNTYAEIQ